MGLVQAPHNISSIAVAEGAFTYAAEWVQPPFTGCACQYSWTQATAASVGTGYIDLCTMEVGGVRLNRRCVAVWMTRLLGKAIWYSLCACGPANEHSTVELMQLWLDCVHMSGLLSTIMAVGSAG